MLLLLAVTALLYWPGLHGGFFFDDEANLVHTTQLHIERLDVASLAQAVSSGRAGPTGRPVAQLSFALSHYFSGLDPFAFKMGNLLVHLCCGVLVFLFARQLTLVVPSLSDKPNVRLFPLLLAAIWLLHPIQLLTVLHTVQRMTGLSALFLFAAMLLHAKARHPGSERRYGLFAAAWLICWPLSLLSKETGMLFPLFAAIWELFIRRPNAGGFDRLAKVLLGTALAGIVGGTIFLFSAAGDWLQAAYGQRAFSLTERLLTEGRVLWRYLEAIILPRLGVFAIQHDDLAVSSGLLQPGTTLPALLGIALFVVLAWRVRGRQPLVAFGIFWFLCGHVLESTFLPLELAHEHRNYVPVFGVAVIVAWGIDRLIDSSNAERHRLAFGLSAAVLLACAILTGLRAYQFGDELRRTQAEARHHPDSPRAQYEAGRALMQRAPGSSSADAVLELARGHFARAVVLDPNTKLPLLGLIQIGCASGRERDTGAFAELTRRLATTPMAPGDFTTLYVAKDLPGGNSPCLTREEADALFAAAVSNPTTSAHAAARIHAWQADYLVLAVRDLRGAAAALDRALAIESGHAGIMIKRAQVAFLQEDYVSANRFLTAATDDRLNREERETKALLLNCMRPNGAANCRGL